MCVALWRAVKIEGGDLDPNGPKWSIDIISVFCKLKTLIKFLVAIFVPWFFVGRAYGRYHKCSPLPVMISMAVVMYAWIVLCALTPVEDGLFYVGWDDLLLLRNLRGWSAHPAARGLRDQRQHGGGLVRRLPALPGRGRPAGRAHGGRAERRVQQEERHRHDPAGIHGDGQPPKRIRPAPRSLPQQLPARGGLQRRQQQLL